MVETVIRAVNISERGLGKLSEVIVSNEIVSAVSASCETMQQAMEHASYVLDDSIEKKLGDLSRYYFPVKSRKVSISHSVTTSSALSGLRYEVSIVCVVDFFYPEPDE